MRVAVNPITRLCESWWGQSAETTVDRQRQFAEELLRLMGWELPIPFTARERSLSLGAIPYVLRGANKTIVAAYFLPGDVLEAPTSVIERYLDFCPATRMLLDEARELKAPYVFMTDLYRSYLYDTQLEEMLLYADDPAEFNRELAVVLSREQVDAGVLEELRRLSYTDRARQLRLWTQTWVKTLKLEGRIPEESAWTAVDRLIVLRVLFRCEVFRRTKWRLEQRFHEITARVLEGPHQGCGNDLVRLFHDMYFDWKIDLFEITPQLDQALQDDDLTMHLLGEFAMLSSMKFDTATILESFNHGTPADKLRVRTVPDFNEEREQYLSRQRVNTVDTMTIHLDVVEEGYRAIFYWFDRLIELYEKLDVDFTADSFFADENTEDAVAEKPNVDLFAWSEIDHKRPVALADRFTHACEKGMLLYCETPQQHRIARLMLTLHLIQKYDEKGYMAEAFPKVKESFKPRPHVMPKEEIGSAPRSRIKVGIVEDW
jgi:hypothetical protein